MENPKMITPETGSLFGASEAGKLGGRARAESLSSDERKAIARKAAQSRWAKSGHQPVPQATHGSDDHPLRIPGVKVEIPCYVLSDGRRVLIQRGMLTALQISQGTAGRGGGDRIAKFIATKSIKPYVPKGLSEVITEPIRFRTPAGGDAYGYEATILADLCDAVLDARKRGKLNYQQEHIAAQCELLVRGFARVGIVALVDEATGYQEVRARDELATILEAFVAKELRQWIRTFDLEFYELICKLRGEPLERVKKRPLYFGRITNDLVYRRLAPDVLQELERLNPADEAGKRRSKHFQWLTGEVGHPKLKEHLAGVMTAMKVVLIQGMSWKEFRTMLDKTHPKWKPMPLFEGTAPK